MPVDIIRWEVDTMPNFKYKAQNQEGAVVTGVLAAGDEQDLHERLKQKKLMLLDAKDLTTTANYKPLKAKALAEYARQIGTLMRAGIPLVRCLQMLAEDEAASMKLISGEYFVSNLKILSNTVKVQDASATGIWLEYVKNSKIAENTIRTTIDVNGGVNGVTSNTAWNNSFYQNNITKFDNSLAFRNRSVNNRISTNQFRKPRQYGIAIDTTSSVTKFSKNTYIKYGKAKVYRANAGQ